MQKNKGTCIDCSKENYLIAKRCNYCYWKHRAIVNGSKPIKQMSKKRVQESKEYTILRIKFLTEKNNLICHAGLENCTKKSTDVHHKKGRIGTNYLDVETWLPVCRTCHTWIEEHPIEAKEKGLSLSKHI